MIAFFELLQNYQYGNIFLLVMRLSILLIILGFFMLPKKYKTKLKNIVETQQEGVMESTNPIVRFAERMMDTKFFKGFKIKEKDEKGKETEEYEKVRKAILAAGGFHNATPQAVQFFRIMFPIVLISILIPIYFINLSLEKHKVITDATIANEVKAVDSVAEGIDALSTFTGQSEESIVLQTVEIPKANPLVVMWLCILPWAGIFIPDLYLKSLAKKKVKLMQKEIPTFRTFAVSMLETKTYPVYNILKILVGSTTALKEPIMECQNEYYVDAKKAIMKLSAKVDDEEFHIVCNALAQAVDEDKETTLMFLRQQLSQYDTMKHLKEQEKIKKKPNLFVMVLGIPLVSILIIWFYPWFLDAMSVLGSL